LELLKELGAKEIVKRTGFSRAAVYAVLAGAKPHPQNRLVYCGLWKDARRPRQQLIDSELHHHSVAQLKLGRSLGTLPGT
jgi:hypothetical protein